MFGTLFTNYASVSDGGTVDSKPNDSCPADGGWNNATVAPGVGKYTGRDRNDDDDGGA